jgi:hypothetical protein
MPHDQSLIVANVTVTNVILFDGTILSESVFRPGGFKSWANLSMQRLSRNAFLSLPERLCCRMPYHPQSDQSGLEPAM